VVLIGCEFHETQYLDPSLGQHMGKHHEYIGHVTTGVRILKIGEAYIFFRLLDASFDLILVLKKLFVLS
jgi:hypothetical protein